MLVVAAGGAGLGGDSRTGWKDWEMEKLGVGEGLVGVEYLEELQKRRRARLCSCEGRATLQQQEMVRLWWRRRRAAPPLRCGTVDVSTPIP